MMDFEPAVNIAIAETGGARCRELVETIRRQGWTVDPAADLEELLAMAESARYHLAVVATGQPADLPRIPVRRLMSLQADIALLFLVPQRTGVSACPALAGSTFDQVFALDCPPETLLGAIQAEAQSVVASQEQYLIVCVDDDEDFLTSLEAFLPRRLTEAMPRLDVDFEFYTTPGEALSALEELGERRLAVMISDQVMPEMDGIELLSRAKSLCPGVRRVLLTGQAGLDSAVAAINSQVLDKYFFKPIEEPKEFSSQVRELLKGYCLRRRADAQRERLMAQFEYIRAMSGADSVRSALELTVQFLREQLCPRTVMFFMAEQESLVLQAGVNMTGAVALGTALPADAGICGWVLRQRRPLLAARPEELPCQILEPCAALPLMAAPLLRGEDPLGAIVASGRWDDRPFARDERMLMSFVADAASVSVGGLRDREAIERHYVATMSSLMETVEAKDGYTRGHTDRVAELAVSLGQAVGVDEELLAGIRHAASLHDIGKIAVPDQIIFKPAGLDAQEYALMKEHPARGDRILQHLRFLDSARNIVRSHHERYDGRGYPDGLGGDQIPLGARILALADAYDAMTSARPYREAMPSADALAEIEINAGRQFDPQLTSAFIQIVREREDLRAPGAADATAVAVQESQP